MKEETGIPPQGGASGRKQIPLKEGLFVVPSRQGEKPQLIAGRCSRCGAVLFPTRPSCPSCQTKEMETIYVKDRAKLYSFTEVTQRPPVFYKAEVPYLLAYVELPEGIRIRTLLTDCTLASLKAGMDMELVIDRLIDDEAGNEIVTYKYRPVKGQ